MLTGEIATGRIQDRVRDADAYRTSRRLTARRASQRRGQARSVASVVTTLLAWPIKH
jgi:hypothetical protein